MTALRAIFARPVGHHAHRRKPRIVSGLATAVTATLLVGGCASTDTIATASAPAPARVAAARPTTTPTVVAPKPSRAAVAARPPAPVKAHLKPRPSVTRVVPAVPAVPAQPAVRRGVHPGAFCEPAGAHGVTAKGAPMTCKTSAADDRYRWRH